MFCVAHFQKVVYEILRRSGSVESFLAGSCDKWGMVTERKFTGYGSNYATRVQWAYVTTAGDCFNGS